MASLKNIAVDVGNTRIKWALFEENMAPEIHYTSLDNISSDYWPDHDQMIISSVTNLAEEQTSKFGSNTLWLTHQTPLPIQLVYDTPDTLGIDRIAAAVGAWDLFPNQPCLIVDLGTCITYDVITDKGNFIGGAIAPGLSMRLRSMHEFTGKLPNLKPEPEIVPFPAKSTKDSMLAGAEQGILHELTGYISLLQKEFEKLRVILTGGDASFFESSIKAPIFVRPELNLSGLNRILLYNESNA